MGAFYFIFARNDPPKAADYENEHSAWGHEISLLPCL